MTGCHMQGRYVKCIQNFGRKPEKEISECKWVVLLKLNLRILVGKVWTLVSCLRTARWTLQGYSLDD